MVSLLSLLIGVTYLKISGFAKYARPPLFLPLSLIVRLFLAFTLLYPGILRVSFLSLLCVAMRAMISSFFPSFTKKLSLSFSPIILDLDPFMFQAGICIGTGKGLKRLSIVSLSVNTMKINTNENKYDLVRVTVITLHAVW